MINIHIGSFLFGLFVGCILAIAIVLAIIYADNGLWSKGFYEGWESGSKFKEKEQDKRLQEVENAD